MRWIFNAPGIVKGFNEPRSFFINDFSAQMVRAFSNCITDAIELSQQILPIYIESPGGDAYALQGVMSNMCAARKKGLRFATITTGQAMSAGAFVFCYGDQGLRFMGEEATIMLHGLSSGYEGKISEMNDYSKNLEDGQYALYEKISKHLKKHPGWLKKQMDIRKDKDWFLNAKEALELGIADHIDVPAFSVEISAEVKIIV